ncbi:MAG: hypothetical protein QOG65_2789 [Actinomycetota bacterium]|nr:hypothetical protein [Actinomycetota bacterium]
MTSRREMSDGELFDRGMVSVAAVLLVGALVLRLWWSVVVAVLLIAPALWRIRQRRAAGR